VSYDEQQLAALSMAKGLLDMTPAEMASLAAKIRSCLVGAAG